MKTIIIVFSFLIHLNNGIDSSLFAQLVPDFRVNDDMTNFSQTNAKVDADAEGNFVVVWEDKRVQGRTSVYCQLISKSGQLIGNNFMVSDSSESALKPSIAVREDGSFIVCWYFLYIKAKIFSNTGMPLTGTLLISDTTSVLNPSVGCDSQGNFVVSWEDYFTTVQDYRIFFQRLNQVGNKIGSNVMVTDYLFVHTQRNPAITVRNNGSFIVTWLDTRPPIFSGSNNVYMQMYDSSGNRMGVNTMVNDSASWSDQYFSPAISSDPVSGKFIIGFTHLNVQQKFFYTKYQRYNSNGLKIGNNSQIVAPNNSGMRGIGINSEGKAVIAYSINAISLNQRIDSSGKNIGGWFVVPSAFPQTPSSYSGIKLFKNRIISVWSNESSGNFDVYCNIRSFSNPDSTVGISQISMEVPKEFELYQNYPNPFNPETTIEYELKRNADIQIKIFDLTGREIKTIISEKKIPGKYKILFDASELSGGVYMYSLRVDDEIVGTKKLVLIK